MQLFIPSSRDAVATAGVVRLPRRTEVWEAPWSLWWPRVARLMVLLVTDMLALVLAMSVGYLLWAGVVPMAPQATSVVERLLSRQMGPLGRDLVSMATTVGH